MKIPELKHNLISQNYTNRQSFLLQKMGIQTVEDLLTYFPFRYEDRSRISTIADILLTQESAIVKVVVTDHQHFFWNKKRQSKIVVKDHSASAELVAFNMRGMEKSMPIGQEFYLYAKFEFRFNKIQSSQFEFESPGKFSSENSSLGKLLPIYRLTEGIKLKEFLKIIKKSLDLYLPEINDPIPKYFRDNRNLLNKKECITYLHFPQQLEQTEKARIRGAYEEFLSTKMALELRRQQETKNIKTQSYIKQDILEQLRNVLPFVLTKAQEKVIDEIRNDLNQIHAMHRLVQGDVGSGKTIVALAAMLLAAHNGHQVAFLAPTEVLAFQHYKKIFPLAEKLQISCALLTGSITGKNRQGILDGLQKGSLSILIGTHAIFQPEVSYHNLSLVIIDEQHKFGVEQRSALIKKGSNPDILVMTATPIPRTITLSIYGDLDISIIDELPAGRQTIITKKIKKNHYRAMLDQLQKEIQQGRQAFIVCPFIEENEKNQGVQSAEQVYLHFTKLFPQYQISLIHGRMSQEEKDSIMEDFSQNKVHILVATTVIEVGIDIPNASVMIIENAERFGLAQLHQLRGRVGRGNHKSFCFVVDHSYEVDSRLDFFCATTDGFAIAEEDLRIRGAGEILGTRQTGSPLFKLADFSKDQKLLLTATKDSDLIFSQDHDLQLPIHANLLKFLTLDDSFRVFSG